MEQQKSEKVSVSFADPYKYFAIFIPNNNASQTFNSPILHALKKWWSRLIQLFHSEYIGIHSYYI